jgi:hypothetical protein
VVVACGHSYEHSYVALLDTRGQRERFEWPLLSLASLESKYFAYGILSLMIGFVIGHISCKNLHSGYILLPP